MSIWLDKEMNWFGGSTGKRGRSPTYSDAAIQFCLSLKCLFGLPLRRSMGLIESLLKLLELAWPVPKFSTISRRQKHLQVTIPYRARNDVLHLLVDNTGVKMLGKGDAKECPVMEEISAGCESQKRGRESYPAIGTDHLEKMEWLPPAQPGRNKNALLQTIG